MNTLKTQTQFSFGKSQDINQTNQSLISIVCQNPIFQQDLINEAEMLYNTLNSYQGDKNNITPIQKIYSQSGVWYCTISQNISIGLLVTSQFPIASAMRLLRKIEDQVKNKLYPLNIKALQLEEPNIRNYLNLYDKDCYTDDIIEITAKSMDSIQGTMENNIKKTIQNQQALDIVHHKSEEVAQLAGKFQSGASQLKNQMQCQQYMIYGIGSSLIILVAAYIIYRIF